MLLAAPGLAPALEPLAAVATIAWVYLLAFRGGFWRARPRLEDTRHQPRGAAPRPPPPAPRSAPGLGGGPAAHTPPAAPQDFALIEQAWNLLHTQYVEAKSLDSKQLAYGAIDGMTNAVGDTGHTSFMTPAERAEASAALSGSYAGIGAEIDSTGGQPTIVGVIRGGPAEAAGLQPGDQLVRADGKDVSGESLDLIAGSIRGPAGTSVTLTLQRAGVTTPVTVTIVRAQVTIRPVSWATVPGTQVCTDQGSG